MDDLGQVKLKEGQFLGRLRENMAGAGTLSASDSLAELRRLTEGRFLRSELEAKYPLGRAIFVRVHSKARSIGKVGPQTMLTGRVVVRLERFVEQGADDEPISMTELHGILSQESDAARRNRYESMLGLFSPTGWVGEARRFVQNEPPGSGWAATTVHPILIGPEITEMVWDPKDGKLRQYIQYFCGLTVEERRRVCTDEIQRAIVIQEFANLEKIAAAKGFDIEFVKGVAKELCKGARDLKLATVRGVGPVVKRTI